MDPTPTTASRVLLRALRAATADASRPLDPDRTMKQWPGQHDRVTPARSRSATGPNILRFPWCHHP